MKTGPIIGAGEYMCQGFLPGYIGAGDAQAGHGDGLLPLLCQAVEIADPCGTDGGKRRRRGSKRSLGIIPVFYI